MSYDIGTHVDLTYLNKVEPVSTAGAKSGGSLYEVGTQIMFEFTNKKLRSFRRIPVVFA